MALGGGVFTTQNKKLAGSYINFVSAQRANANLGDRGICALPMELDWGQEGVIKITNEDFIYNSQKILGYDYTHEKCLPFREIFKNAQTAYIYKLNNASVKAENEFCTAKYAGVRGNDIKIIITANVDSPLKFDVKTLLDNIVLDEQKGFSNTSELKSNNFVDFKKGVALKLTANTPLTGGSNGDALKASCELATSKVAGKDGNNISIAVSTGEPLTVKEAKKASCKYGEAVTAGAEGNNLKIVITQGNEYEKTPAVKATCKYGTLKTAGASGNAYKVKITQNADTTTFDIAINNGSRDVYTKQKVSTNINQIGETNDFVEWASDVALAVEDVPFANGADAVMANSFNVVTKNNDLEVAKLENIRDKSGLRDNAFVAFVKSQELSVEEVQLTGGADAQITQRYNVETKVNGVVKEKQENVTTSADLVDNNYVIFNKGVALQLGEQRLEGGGGNITGANWQEALNTLEGFSFNTLGIATNEETIKALATAYTKRLRDEVGVKFQTVVFNHRADEKGVINLVNGTKYDATDPRLIYWLTGAQCACKVYASLTNTTYNGELDVDTSRTQSQLENCIDNGEFVFHNVGDDVRVLTDINSKTSITEEEGEDFKSNQTIRVLDQIGNDIAAMFNDRYLGKVPNDDAGRISLWNDIVKHHQELLRLRAIENFTPEDVTIAAGNDKKSVVVNDSVSPTNALEKLYMTCVVN